MNDSIFAFEVVPENLPRHPIPVALVGRLAVDNKVRRQRLGETLLVHVLQSVQRAARIVEIYAVVVDALDESAKSFYLKYGFNSLTDDPLHLYLPMRAVERLGL
jgi:predicted GNAT family N-acyltransferase